MNTLTESMIDELNTLLEDTCLKFVLDEMDNVAKIVLKNNNGLDSYIINISNDTEYKIREFFMQRNIKIHWNNTKRINADLLE
jgi:hypothetical protein